MNEATVASGILVALGIAGFIAYRFLKSRTQPRGGFRDWVKRPDYKQAAADFFAARKALKVPDDISDDEIQKMVDRLFVRDDDDFNMDRLKLIGSKAVPFMIAALENSKRASTHFVGRGHALDATSPFQRIVELLSPIGPPETAGPLIRYIDHEDDRIRRLAAIALGNTGSSACIDPMLRALHDDDDHVRSYALMGIKRGMTGQRCTAEFLEAMFPAMTRLLNRDDRSIGGHVPELLLSIDSARAIPILLSPEYFSIENRQVHFIIRALNKAGHRIPHDTLLPFLTAVRPLVDKYPHNYDYAEALNAYAHNPDSSAESLFRTELMSSNDKVQEAAANALAFLSGVINAREVTFGAFDKHGFDQLTRPQQLYFAVSIYDSEVNNGGHAQYFVSSSGDHWRSALEGMTEIGAVARAGILHETVSLFGSAGPSVENEPRHREIARFSRRQNKLLGELDNKYYACDEHVDALLAQYALRNQEHFVART